MEKSKRRDNAGEFKELKEQLENQAREKEKIESELISTSLSHSLTPLLLILPYSKAFKQPHKLIRTT